MLPMNPYERRAVHQYLQDNFPDLVTHSEGEGAERHIVISFRGMEVQATSDTVAEESA